MNLLVLIIIYNFDVYQHRYHHIIPEFIVYKNLHLTALFRVVKGKL